MNYKKISEARLGESFIVEDGELTLLVDDQKIDISRSIVVNDNKDTTVIKLEEEKQVDVIECKLAQVTFYLSSMPNSPCLVQMFNESGLELINGIDFAVSAKTVSYIATSPFFEDGEKVVFTYLKTK